MWQRFLRLAVAADPLLAATWTQDEILIVSINDWDGPQSYRF